MSRRTVAALASKGSASRSRRSCQITEIGNDLAGQLVFMEGENRPERLNEDYAIILTEPQARTRVFISFQPKEDRP